MYQDQHKDSRRIASFRFTLAQHFVCGLDGADQNIQADEDQIDVGDGDCDLAGDHQTAVEDVIERLEQRKIRALPFFTNNDLIEVCHRYTVILGYSQYHLR